MDLYPKYIVQIDSEGPMIIMSKVTYHKHLRTKDSNIAGGGMFRFISSEKTFLLYGESHDFGPPKQEDIEAAIRNDRVYTNTQQTHSVANKYKFRLDIQSEIIDLN